MDWKDDPMSSLYVCSLEGLGWGEAQDFIVDSLMSAPRDECGVELGDTYEDGGVKKADISFVTESGSTRIGHIHVHWTTRLPLHAQLHHASMLNAGVGIKDSMLKRLDQGDERD